MLFKKGAALFSIEIEREQGEDVMYINATGAPYVPSISMDASIMSRTIDLLVENPQVSRIVFVQQRNYNYPNAFKVARKYSNMADLTTMYELGKFEKSIYELERFKSLDSSPDDKLEEAISRLKKDPPQFDRTIELIQQAREEYKEMAGHVNIKGYSSRVCIKGMSLYLSYLDSIRWGEEYSTKDITKIQKAFESAIAITNDRNETNPSNKFATSLQEKLDEIMAKHPTTPLGKRGS